MPKSGTLDPVKGSVWGYDGDIGSFAPDTDAKERPFTYDPSVIGGSFPNVPDFKGVEASNSGGPMDSGRSDGASVADIFRMSGSPYTRENIYDLTNYQMNSRSPYNPGGDPSVLKPMHYVPPVSEKFQNKFFSKPYDQMSDRGKVNFHAYHPDINKATAGMTKQEKLAYSKARYGYDNSAYFKTRPETKKTFEDMASDYKPLDQRIADRKNNV